MTRFAFLDWMRGLAVLLMIQCHTFNSFARVDVRAAGPYVASQFIGGMAAPLFLFMAGMTLAFQMESAERRGLAPVARWRAALRRGGYVLGIAFLFRFSNFAVALPLTNWQELIKVDILNCMGVAMALVAAAALFDRPGRIRFAIVAGATVAAASPLMANLDWSGAPALLQEYLVHPRVPLHGRFPLFPNGAYVAFGLAAGSIVKATERAHLDRLMQWTAMAGLGLILAGEYLANLPYSVYAASNFWTNSPTLIAIRCGIALLILAACYLWTEFGARDGWSWMQALGRNSLMVYWVHVMLVYGDIVKPLKRAMDIPTTAFAVAAVTALMTGLAAGWQGWKARKAQRLQAAAASA